MNDEHLQIVEKHLSDQEWRLNNLYKIIDKEGKNVTFQFNWAQRELFENIWYSNVILKARQLGISTFVCLYFLDTCLFRPNIAAGIIAHTREDAEHMFKRIKFAYDQLPDAIKNLRTATVDSARELVFNNHSSLRVGTSMRGSTLQYLHISEFGKICAHFPDKAREIVTGSLNTLGSRQYVFIESTAEGKEGYFYEICKQAEAAQMQNKKLSSLDYRFHFYPWFDCPDYTLKKGTTIPKEIEEYFQKLRHQGINLSEEQKAWYYKKLLTQKDDMKREYPSTPDESFESAIDGSFYAKWIREARFEGRVGNVPWDKQARVSLAFDPGYLDSCALVFFQCIGQEIHIIDYYENSGEGLSHYIKIIKSKPYIYDQYFGPHDIESHQFSTGLSTKEVGASLGIHFITLQTLKLRLEDGIEAVRGLFPRLWIDEKNCSRLIKCIENYRKEFDVNYQIYKSKPVHDQYSHGCFVSGTLIKTAEGEKPIESVQVGDYVTTPNGSKRVLKTFSYSSKDVIKIKTTNSYLVCTPNHKIFCHRGLIHADSLRYDDILYSSKENDLWNKSGIYSGISNTGFRESFLSAETKNSLCLTGIVSDGTADITVEDQREWGACIKPFGELTEGKSRIDGTYTIKMVTPETILLKIWNSLVQVITLRFICKIRLGVKTVESLFINLWSMRKNGMPVQKGSNGIDFMQKNTNSGKKSIKHVLVSCAGNHSHQSKDGKSFAQRLVKLRSDIEGESTTRKECAKCVVKNFVATNMPKSERVVSIAAIACRQELSVYDFEVEDDHCYYANGILVSNSDALRYAAIAIKTHVDSAKSGISDDDADRMYNKHHPVFK